MPKPKGNGKQKPKRPANKAKSGRTAQSSVRVLSVPAARGFAHKYSAPRILQSGDGLRIRHREYFWTTVGGLGSTFGVWQPNGTAPTLNPMNDFIFPWLSNIAQCYERYTFHNFTFGYMPRCSSNTTGVIMIGVETDPLDKVPATEAIMLSYKGVVDGPAWSELKARYTTADLHGSMLKKYCNRHYDTGNNSGYDSRSADCGYLLYYGDGPASTGKFYVDYDISFYTPQLPPTGTPSAGLIADGGAQSTSEIFGDEPTIHNIGIEISKVVGIPSKYTLKGLNVGDILEVTESVTSVLANTIPNLSTAVVTGLTLLASSSAASVLAGTSGAVKAQYRVTDGIATMALAPLLNSPGHASLSFLQAALTGNIW